MAKALEGVFEIMLLWFGTFCWAFMSVAELIVGIVCITFWHPDKGYHDLYFGLGVGFMVLGGVSSLSWLCCMCYKKKNGNTFCEDIC
jgi:hypothetical protein